MVKRNDLIEFIYKQIRRDFLEKALIKDELANGAQFLGKDTVETVVLGTSLNEEFLLKAKEKKASFCIFHHGFDPRTYKSRYPVFSQKRLKIIFENQMTIMGFHYCLDAHPEFGNNVTIIKKLGAIVKEPVFDEWGYTGEFETEKDVLELKSLCQKLFDHDVFTILTGSKKIKKIAVVSGAAKPGAVEIAELEEKGVELFISGETSESTPHKMKESNINYFICGHYATEGFGVKELGERIRKNFGKKISVTYINIFNSV